MFFNILAEMARRNVSKTEMSKKLNISINTFDKKIEGSLDFTVSEVFQMQEIFNDANCTFEYLLCQYS